MKHTLGKILYFLAATGSVLLAACLIGLILSIISNFIYIHLIFPFVFGFAGLVMLVGTLDKFKIRGKFPEIFLAILMPLTIYAAYHYANYQTFRFVLASEMNDEIVHETGKPQPEVADIFVDYALEQETGRTGFIGYMLYQAQEGVSIGRWYSQNKTNLGPYLSWVYWLVELVIIAFMSGLPIYLQFGGSAHKNLDTSKHLM